MLALTDVGLAYLCIAATRVDPRAREQWLKQTAERLEARSSYERLERVEAARRAYEAERKALERERDANEQIPCKIWPKRRTVERLIGRFVLDGWLTPEEADDFKRVEQAIAALLDQHADALADD